MRKIWFSDRKQPTYEEASKFPQEKERREWNVLFGGYLGFVSDPNKPVRFVSGGWHTPGLHIYWHGYRLEMYAIEGEYFTSCPG